MIKAAWKVLNPTVVNEADVVEESNVSKSFVEIDLADLNNIKYVIGRSQPTKIKKKVSLPDTFSENLSKMYSTAAPENVATDASGLKKISRAGEALRSLDENIEKLHAIEDNGRLYRALTLCPKHWAHSMIEVFLRAFLSMKYQPKAYHFRRDVEPANVWLLKNEAQPRCGFFRPGPKF